MTMSADSNLLPLISQLEELKQSQDHLKIGQALDQRFDLTIKETLEKWSLNKNLSPDEIQFLDYYSSLQLQFVERCFLLFNPAEDDGSLVQILRKCLYRTKSIDVLRDTVMFIREDRDALGSPRDHDQVLLFFMRMIDARTLAYRLCFKDLHPPPNELNEELIDCLMHRHAKTYLHEIKDLDDSINKSSWSNCMHYRHQFFIGCCTFGVALFEKNEALLKGEEHKKYIFLLAKYVRIILKQPDFAKDERSLYCLRGILAILTNCVPTQYWMQIINRALVAESGHEARKQNPFNEDLFSLIIGKLLACPTLQKSAIESASCKITLLIDIALIFLNKWSDVPSNLTNDDQDEPSENDASSDSSVEVNQVFRLLRSDRTYDGNLQVSQIITPYVHAQYDRLRLMALATLSNIMEFSDFQRLQHDNPDIAANIIKIIFDFIRQASLHPTRRFKGIPCDRLLCYLLRFLTQDVMKKQTIPHIDTLLTMARDRDLYALKIFRRLSSSPEVKESLINHNRFEIFLNQEADILFDCDAVRKKLIEDIRRNIQIQPKREAPAVNTAGGRQAFISYCHQDKATCLKLYDALKEADLFSKIWIDHDFMRGNMVDAITNAMNQCQVVFAVLSDAYCTSDYCRLEWNFAFAKKIKVYALHSVKDFKRDAYDWVVFKMSDDLYYRMYQPGDLEKLIKHLGETDGSRVTKPSKTEPSPPTTDPIMSPTTSATSRINGSQADSKKKPVRQWSSQDVQDWCRDKKLDKWCEPLQNFHGPALLELTKLLSTDTYLPYFLNTNSLNGFDLALFKSELEILISKSNSKRSPSKRRSIRSMSVKKNQK